MPRLVANEAFTYAGRDLAPGKEFDASDEDARILKIVGRAGDAPKQKPPQPAPAAVQTETAQDAPKAPRYDDKQSSADELFDSPDQSQRRGRHNRRDMRARD